ncbi:MAG: Nif3-like dinuclear metal center hexameric protein [Bacilli bacterium]|nr:Nif3-like dinuclear metal center hexameric protein [Bacilli bacterium]
MTKVKDITNYLLTKYPTSLASSFDLGKVGLQFGSLNQEVKVVMLALDGSTKVIDEAIMNDVDLLITHHPFMFNSMLSMDYDNPLQEKIKQVIKNDLNVFSMHTNFDVAEGGMNEILAKRLGLKNIRFVGDTLNNESFIRTGEVDEISLSDFLEVVKEKLKVDGLRYTGSLNKKIHKVGILAGSGGFELYLASRLHCDAFITGEVKHNQALDAVDLNLSLIEVSHAVERLYKEKVKAELEKEFPNVTFILANNDTDPLKIK